MRRKARSHRTPQGDGARWGQRGPDGGGVAPGPASRAANVGRRPGPRPQPGCETGLEGDHRGPGPIGRPWLRRARGATMGPGGGGEVLGAISCPDSTVVLDHFPGGQHLVLQRRKVDGRGPSARRGAKGGDFASVPCSSKRHCVAAGDNGELFAYDGQQWRPSARLFQGSSLFTQVPRAGKVFCAAVDEQGFASVTGRGRPERTEAQLDYEEVEKVAVTGTDTTCCTVVVL